MSIVSVVIPVRDRERELPGAIESVLGQTHGDLELLVVDDHSADGTGQVAARYVAQDRRVQRLAVRLGSGAQAARNTGIGAARGAHVAFLDSDDEWEPTLLARCLRRLGQTGRQVAYTEGRIAYADAGQVEPCTGVARLEEDAYTTLLQRPPGPVFSSLVVARQALLEIGALDEGLVAFQEWDTCLRLAARWGGFAFVGEPLFTWHRHGNGTISGDGVRNARGYAQVVDKHRGAILAQAGGSALAAHYRKLARLEDQLGHKTRAWYHRGKAVWVRSWTRALLGDERRGLAESTDSAVPAAGIRVYG